MTNTRLLYQNASVYVNKSSCPPCICYTIYLFAKERNNKVPEKPISLLFSFRHYNFILCQKQEEDKLLLRMPNSRVSSSDERYYDKIRQFSLKQMCRLYQWPYFLKSRFRNLENSWFIAVLDISTHIGGFPIDIDSQISLLIT